ncbi:substrate-binding periplasmic protein [Aliamphritea spongicola]|uniref:substrate-binding periplasmic protein n=1 Tax=Aliamphritea spongicola TaxID=707589 RepID=UPI00196A7283|nr:transporter substrate-binding domain-containing protein [Aliamphritea spongicola]MBN3561433.1 transporter substrate-binding domain-containing protein [Aliamphritea spongicola]
MRRRGQLARSLLLGTCLLFTAYTPAWSEEATLKACGHQDYPPWNWHSQGEIRGACADVTRELFGRLGIGVDLSYVGPWKRCQKAVEEGDVDVNICAFINPARQTYSDFTATPMGYNQNAVFVSKDNAFGFNRWADLSGKQAAMVLGVSIGEQFDTFLKNNVNIEWVPDYKSAFMMLKHRRVDFVPFGRESGLTKLATLNMSDDIVPLDHPITTGNLYISISKKSRFKHLLPEINAMIQEPGYRQWVTELLKTNIEKYSAEQARLRSSIKNN